MFAMRGLRRVCTSVCSHNIHLNMMSLWSSYLHGACSGEWYLACVKESTVLSRIAVEREAERLGQGTSCCSWRLSGVAAPKGLSERVLSDKHAVSTASI